MYIHVYVLQHTDRLLIRIILGIIVNITLSISRSLILGLFNTA